MLTNYFQLMHVNKVPGWHGTDAVHYSSFHFGTIELALPGSTQHGCLCLATSKNTSAALPTQADVGYFVCWHDSRLGTRVTRTVIATQHH